MGPCRPSRRRADRQRKRQGGEEDANVATFGWVSRRSISEMCVVNLKSGSWVQSLLVRRTVGARGEGRRRAGPRSRQPTEMRVLAERE